MQRWLDSPERRAFIEEVRDVIEDGDKTSVKAGIDVWFTPDNSPTKPPAYKQFLITLAAIYPLALVIPRLLSPLFEAFPSFKNPFVGGIVINVIIVGLMTYLIMPYATHWLHNWLFDLAANKKSVQQKESSYGKSSGICESRFSRRYRGFVGRSSERRNYEC